MFKCLYCSKEYDSYDSLRKHTARIHKVNSINFYNKFFNEVKPDYKCKCGCGEKIEIKFSPTTCSHSFNYYIRGHSQKVYNNWGHNKIAFNKSVEKRKELYASGEIVVWNKGETKATHASILKSSLKWNDPIWRQKQMISRSNYAKNSFGVKTSIEIEIENILKDLKINYEYDFPFGGFRYDFFLQDFNTVIECDGDYWHGNPKKYSEDQLDETQVFNKSRDIIKEQILQNNEINLFRFWETEINENLNMVKKKIEKLCFGNSQFQKTERNYEILEMFYKPMSKKELKNLLQKRISEINQKNLTQTT